MKKELLIEQEEKQAYIKSLCYYVAKCIQINYKYNKNNNKVTYEQLLNSCFDNFSFTQEELNNIYNYVDNILENKYKLIFAHNKQEEPIHMVSIKG